MATSSALLGLTLLVIGDSHLASPKYLIGTLHDQLLERGAHVVSVGVCGVHAADWVKETPGDCGRADRRDQSPVQRQDTDAKTTPIAELITKEHPDAVVVVMGDTIGSYKNPEFPASWAHNQVTTLTRAISETGVACYWVGPGWGTEGGRFGKTYERVKVLNAFLAENVAPCTYIDSTRFAQPGEWKTVDGQHYLSAGYRAWGQAIAEAIAAQPPKKKTAP
jgi:hypothetical protein